MKDYQIVGLAFALALCTAALMLVMANMGDKIADSIEAGRGVDTLYVADSLVYKLEIQVNDTLSGDLLELLGNYFKTIRIVPRGTKD